jgi:hypothetical protein
MIIPPTPVALLVAAALAILLALDWFVGAMAYNQRPMRSRVGDSPKDGETGSLKEAA